MTHSDPAAVTLRERTVPVLGHWDVVVCGGGPAGCAAAWAAARAGARTLLIERDGHCGGTTVSSLVCVVLSTNGVDLQGVWHEWARALARRDGFGGLDQGRHTLGPHWWCGTVHPEAVKVAWDEVLTAAGVELLHHAWATSAICDDAGRVCGVTIACAAGQRAVLAKQVVDASGDGVVAADAGATWDCGHAGQPWAMGVGIMWRVADAPGIAAVDAGVALRGRGRRIAGSTECLGGLLRVLAVDPLDPFALTRASREGRAEVWSRQGGRLRAADGALLVATPNRPGVRSSRRIHGVATVSDEDLLGLTKHAHSIARASWEIDVHPAETAHGKVINLSDPRVARHHEGVQNGDWCDIPFGALVPRGVDGVLLAGRCISAGHLALSSLRIQQTCMAIGEAAGTAAAWCAARGVPARDLDGAELSAHLTHTRAAIEPFWRQPVTV